MATQTISNAGPKIRTKLPGPKAQAVLQGDQKYISPPSRIHAHIRW